MTDRCSAESERAIEVARLIDVLRADEGDSVTIMCDNPDFNGQPNCAIECCGDWTGWLHKRFAADTLLDALSMAMVERNLPSPREVVATSNGHHWIERFNLVCCRDCGFIRRTDDQNKPCQGPAGVGIRKDLIPDAAQPTQPSAESGNTIDYDFDNLTDLVSRFSAALLEKLKAAESKYGHNSGWMRDDWMRDCQRQLYAHIAKGDPRDVAAYCAFMWHHGWRTAGTGSADIVERLRARRIMRDGGSGNAYDIADEDCEEAAAEIERLRAAAQPKQQPSGLFLAFTEQEIAAVEALSEYHQLSQLQTMRQALRLYQLSDKRIRDGETMTFSGDVRRAEEFSALAIPSTDREGK